MVTPLPATTRSNPDHREGVVGSENTQRRFTYDSAGNQTTKEEVIKRNGSTVSSKSGKFYYNGYNQLQRVQDDNGRFTEYTYNGSGLRTKKVIVGAAVYGQDEAVNYTYDSNSNIILETDQNNLPTAKNIRGLRLIYRENNPGQANDNFLYYLHNAHGDVTQLLNEKAEVVKDYRYDTFGQEEPGEVQAFGGKQSTELWRQEVEKIDNPFRYCGEYQDSETGNYYLRARYYDPTIQRFINEDSYGVEQGASWLDQLYGYGNNNPLTFIDPTGHTSDNASSEHVRLEKAKKKEKQEKEKKKLKQVKPVYGPPRPSAKPIVKPTVKNAPSQGTGKNGQGPKPTTKPGSVPSINTPRDKVDVTRCHTDPTPDVLLIQGGGSLAIGKGPQVSGTFLYDKRVNDWALYGSLDDVSGTKLGGFLNIGAVNNLDPGKFDEFAGYSAGGTAYPGPLPFNVSGSIAGTNSKGQPIYSSSTGINTPSLFPVSGQAGKSWRIDTYIR